MVGAADGGEGDLGAAGAHGDAERRAGGVGGGVGVAHHEALPLQHDGLRLVLPARQPRRAQQQPQPQPQPRAPHGAALPSLRSAPRRAAPGRAARPGSAPLAPCPAALSERGRERRAGWEAAARRHGSAGTHSAGRGGAVRGGAER